MSKFKIITVLFTIMFISGCTAESVKQEECNGNQVLKGNECVEEEHELYFPIQSSEVTNYIPFDITHQGLKDVIKNYESDKFEEKPNLHDVWSYDIDNTPENAILDYHVYKEDIEDIDVYDYSYSSTRHFYDEIKYLTDVLESISQDDIGEHIFTIIEYTTRECCDGITGFYDQTQTEQGEVYVLYGENYIYAEITELGSNDVNDNRVYYVEFDDNVITVFKYYQVQKAKFYDINNKVNYKIINYTKGEESKFISVIDDEKLIAKIDPIGNIKVIRKYVDATFYSESNLENETFFWSYDNLQHIKSDVDYRNLVIYKDGVFQVEHRLLYLIDDDEFLGSNNSITYNAKYVDGWEYILSGYGEIENSDERYYQIFSGENVGHHILSPNYVLEVNVELDGYINEDNYTNISFDYGENYSYSRIPFTEFITYWTSYEDIWDINGSYASTITLDGTSYNLSLPIQELAEKFTNDGFEELLLNLGFIE